MMTTGTKLVLVIVSSEENHFVSSLTRDLKLTETRSYFKEVIRPIEGYLPVKEKNNLRESLNDGDTAIIAVFGQKNPSTSIYKS
jgi:hypothetical protein